MTIDERLEALAQSVELIAGMQRHNEDLFERFQKENEERFQKMDYHSTRLDRRMAEVMETINQLGRIAGIHQDRLDEHERRLDKLEG